MDIERFKALHISAEHDAPVIYVIDSAEHPFDIAACASAIASTVVSIPVRDWNAALTPWPAAGFYESDPWFEGRGGQTLESLCAHVIPAIESELDIAPKKRAVCGYSLGGLFALYAFVGRPAFDACACISGSLWYEGWMAYLRGLDLKDNERVMRGFAFFSVGKKERKSGLPLFRCVEENMGECARILEACGCRTNVVVGPGNHMQHIPERFGAALSALDEFLLA